jgi:ribosomal peptide maturation radical SAM protein 1
MTQVALISAPWPLFNRPSIQLGALEAFIKQTLPRVRVDAHHFYLNIAELMGYEIYGQISRKTWLAESLYAALLYPERTDQIERFWRKQCSGLPLVRGHGFGSLLETLKEISLEILEHIRWEHYLLAGFSICSGQLTSSLFFIRHAKRKAPSLKIVVGGSSCSEAMGERLLATFPEIDFVVQGEGERPLLDLIKAKLVSPEETKPVAALLSREMGRTGIDGSQIPNLDDLPIPDYSDYFRLLGSFGKNSRFLPSLPMEMSRGCWWQKSDGKRVANGCAFCNLNLQWEGYRAKSHERILHELETLTDRHQILSVSMMDNLLPSKDLAGLFERVAAMGKDFRLFGEIRATTPREVLGAMGVAGMREVQVGIESLSTRLLKKMNKGTSAIDNLEIMKHCETPGLPDLSGNLILSFPSSDERDVTETLDNLELAQPFRPLKEVTFWLGSGSPVFMSPKTYGIQKLGNHPHYKELFPPAVYRSLHLMFQGYQGGVRYQNRLWRPVRERVKRWEKTYRELHAGSTCEPILSHFDGGHFLIIRQRRLRKYDMTHHLKGSSRNIYRFCETQRTIRDILAHFPGFGEDKVRPFLRMMVDKRLMCREGDRYLSLSVPARGPFAHGTAHHSLR